VAQTPRVIIVGGGFGGLYAARALAGAPVAVTLLDRRNHHVFQPLLYQVAAAALSPGDIASPIRWILRRQANVEVLLAEVRRVDPARRAVVLSDGEMTYDYLILAAGAAHAYFGHDEWRDVAPGLKTLEDALEIRRSVLLAFERAERESDPAKRRPLLTFVVVGGGPTGVELAGALADMIHDTLPSEFRDLAVTAAQVHIVDLGHTLLGPFSDKAHDYVAKVLGRKGVRLHLGVAVTGVGPGHVDLADGTTIKTHCVVWGGGIMAPPLAGAAGLPQGRGGRIDVQPDLTVDGAPGVYAAGDVANIPGGADGHAHPQLGSVALQSGVAAAENVLADFAGKPRTSFHYHDKGIMAMIGRGAAIAEVGAHRHELHGVIAFSAWLGVHSLLMTGVRNRIDAFIAWGWDNFSSSHGPQVLDRSESARIDWGDDETPAPAEPADARVSG